MSDFYFDLAAEYERLGDAIVPQILPTNKYIGTVTKATVGQTQAGKPKITVTLTVREGPYAGKTVTEQLTWSPENETASRIFASNLAVLGATQQWIKETRPSLQEIADRMIGSVVEFTAKEDEWNGQPRNRVNFNKTISTGAGANATPTGAPQIASLGAAQPATQLAAQPTSQAAAQAAQPPAQPAAQPAAGGWPTV